MTHKEYQEVLKIAQTNIKQQYAVMAAARAERLASLPVRVGSRLILPPNRELAVTHVSIQDNGRITVQMQGQRKDGHPYNSWIDFRSEGELASYFGLNRKPANQQVAMP